MSVEQTKDFVLSIVFFLNLVVEQSQFYLRKLVLSDQVIPGHENPQKRWTMFDGYLFKYCCSEYQTFHQVCEKTSQ